MGLDDLWRPGGQDLDDGQDIARREERERDPFAEELDQDDQWVASSRPRSSRMPIMRTSPRAILRFLGTRGEIDVRSRSHRRHSSFAVSVAGKTILVDCGEDWLSALPRLRPDAILITHAHPDHAGGLARGAPCPVYAAPETVSLLPRAVVARVLPHRVPRRVCGLTVVAFPVVHSLRAPAVGYRLALGDAALFYVPDVVAIVDEREALTGVSLYVGDGATLTRPILRLRGAMVIGHTAIREQLRWCGRHAVPRAIFTHCGSQVVRGDPRVVAALVRRMGHALGVQARIAYDGMRLDLREAAAPARIPR